MGRREGSGLGFGASGDAFGKTILVLGFSASGSNKQQDPDLKDPYSQSSQDGTSRKQAKTTKFYTVANSLAQLSPQPE